MTILLYRRVYDAFQKRYRNIRAFCPWRAA